MNLESLFQSGFRLTEGAVASCPSFCWLLARRVLGEPVLGWLEGLRGLEGLRRLVSWSQALPGLQEQEPVQTLLQLEQESVQTLLQLELEPELLLSPADLK